MGHMWLQDGTQESQPSEHVASLRISKSSTVLCLNLTTQRSILDQRTNVECHSPQRLLPHYPNNTPTSSFCLICSSPLDDLISQASSTNP